MVADNVERLKRIVDDVMEVAPGAVPQDCVIDAAAQVAAVCAEWTRSAGAAVADVLQLELPAEPLHVHFDAEHLRRVLVNLLDNARRHGSGTPGAVLVRLHGRDAGEALLGVTSDGESIPPDVRALSVRAVLLDAQPGHGPWLVHLPGVVRALWRAHQLPPAAGGRPPPQRVFGGVAPPDCPRRRQGRPDRVMTPADSIWTLRAVDPSRASAREPAGRPAWPAGEGAS